MQTKVELAALEFGCLLAEKMDAFLGEYSRNEIAREDLLKKAQEELGIVLNKLDELKKG